MKYLIAILVMLPLTTGILSKAGTHLAVRRWDNTKGRAAGAAGVETSVSIRISRVRNVYHSGSDRKRGATACKWRSDVDSAFLDRLPA